MNSVRTLNKVVLLMLAAVCTQHIACERGHDAVAKNKFGDSDRIKCRVIAVGGPGTVLDRVLSKAPENIAANTVAEALKLKAPKELRENLILCEKRWVRGRDFQWVELEPQFRRLLLISTPSSVPSSDSIVIFTSKRVPGKKVEDANVVTIGTVGDVRIWRYTDEVRAG